MPRGTKTSAQHALRAAKAIKPYVDPDWGEDVLEQVEDLLEDLHHLAAAHSVGDPVAWLQERMAVARAKYVKETR